MQKKRLFTIITWAVVLILAICFLPLPTYVNKELTGIGFYLVGHEKEDIVTEETVQVKGWYMRYLFRDNRFWGDIHFPGLDSEMYYEMVNYRGGVPLYKEEFIDGTWASLTFYSGKLNRIVPAGMIYERSGFDQVMFESFVEEGQYLVFPTETREAAVALANGFVTGDAEIE